MTKQTLMMMNGKRLNPGRRRSRFIIPSPWVLVISAFCSIPVSIRSAELHWRNGERVGGDFLAAEPDRLAWRTPMFTEPIRVRLEALKQVIRHKDPEDTNEAFSVRLADGSRLYGTITRLDDQTMELKSARAGTLHIARDAVVEVRRLKADGLLFAAPTSTKNWIENPTAGVTLKEKLWRVVPGGALMQVGWNRSVTLPVDAPEQVEMQFSLSSTVRPEFKVELKAKDDERVIVETWVDDVVLQGRVFQRVQNLGDHEHGLKLTVFWNRRTGLCAIYNGAGQKIAETSKPAVEEKRTEAPEPEKKKEKPGGGKGGLFGALLGVVQGAAVAEVKAALEAKAQANRAAANHQEAPLGFTLLNKGPDLRLEELRIRAWNGQLPEGLTTERPRIDLTDGQSLKATAFRASATSVTARDGKRAETTLPWDRVLAMEFAEASPFYQLAPDHVELWFTDGEWLSGRLVHVRNDTATLKTAWSAEPVAFKITRMHHLEFKYKESGDASQDLAALDTLTIAGKTLHGTLDAGGEPQPRWKPVGGLASVPISLATLQSSPPSPKPDDGKPPPYFEIVRASSAQPEGLHSEALFYLNDGDVLPGRLRAIDERQVDVDSDLVAVHRLPAEKMQAIQFGGAALNLEGFEDPGWQRVRGTDKTVKRNGKNGVEFEAGGSWGHPSFMQANEISFVMHSNGFNALRVRLFCDGVNRLSTSTNLLFGHMGSEMCFGLESSDDQMDRQFRVRSTGPMPVRITIGENEIEVFLNEVSARKIAITPKMRSGGGLVLEPFSLWGNGERELTLQAFSARIAPGRVAVPIVDSQAKEHAITVPRFRKEDPPHHALLAANGDLLRGVIEAATAGHFAIRSGLESIQVPQDRVKVVVWLIKPADDVSAAFEASAKEKVPSPITHWLLLNNGGRLGLKVERFEKDTVIGQNELLGACRVPLKQVHTIRSTEPPGNAAMAALKNWKLKFAPEPVLPESGGESSPLLNKDAKPFKLPLLAGGEFDLAKEKGKVIVLDFWATWCGPCIKSLPGMMDEMSAFDADKVRFIGVNQAEPKDQVKTFLETRGWEFEVVLDADQRIGQSFGVEGIPHTVVIGPDGKVAHVKTGFEPDGAKKIAEIVKKLLEK